jgi:hypothetical protein
MPRPRRRSVLQQRCLSLHLPGLSIRCTERRHRLPVSWKGALRRLRDVRDTRMESGGPPAAYVRHRRRWDASKHRARRRKLVYSFLIWDMIQLLPGRGNTPYLQEKLCSPHRQTGRLNTNMLWFWPLDHHQEHVLQIMPCSAEVRHVNIISSRGGDTRRPPVDLTDQQ